MQKNAFRYRISPLRHKHSFVMKDGSSICGTISLRGIHRGTAILNIDGEETMIRRTAAIHKNLAIRYHSENFYFSSDLLSRGEISIRTHHYKWRPLNFRWTSWAWVNAHGDKLMEVKLRRTVTGLRGEIISSRPLDDIWKLQLAMTGWYLMLLNHGRTGVHILSALRIATSR